MNLGNKTRGTINKLLIPLVLILSLMGCQANVIQTNSRVSSPLPVTSDPASAVNPLASTQAYLPFINRAKTPTPVFSATPPQTNTAQPIPSVIFSPTGITGPGAVEESFEGSQTNWQVATETYGSGAVQQSSQQHFAGSQAALISTSGAGNIAMLRAKAFNDSPALHSWGERPGTWFWQRAMLYIPSSTIDGLGPDGYITIAGFWPGSGGPYGWWLRLRSDHRGNAALYAYGYDLNQKAVEFNIYGQMPLNAWVDFTIGLHSQSGPGVKRSFAVMVNGNFYGWYHQGNMAGETFDHAALGVLDTNVSAPLSLFVDDWYFPGTQALPAGPDNRPMSTLQTQDFRSAQGIQWQIDWSTWENNLVLDPTFGLYSSTWRLQSGRNLDRMPDLTSGWAQIMVDWPQGSPPIDAQTGGAFAGLIGFHKEINREQNLEVSPMLVNGTVKLVYDAWVGAEHDFATWSLPKASQPAQVQNIPEPGDILRVRWEKVNQTNLHVQVSYYDASANTWYRNVIDDTHDLSRIPSQDSSLPGPINYLDGYHNAASVTIDSPSYSIREFTVGSLDTYPAQ